MPRHLLDFSSNLLELETQKVVLGTHTHLNAKTVYRTYLSPHVNWGKMETRHPDMLWSRVWYNVKKLPEIFKETYFKLNHNLLPIGERLLTTKVKTQAQCPLCQHPMEDLHHFLYLCGANSQAMQWLVVEMASYDYKNVRIKNFLHLDTPRNGTRANLLAATYVTTLWHNRRRKKTTSIAQLDCSWSLNKRKYNLQ